MDRPVPFPVAMRALGLLWLFSALAVGKLHLLQRVPAPVIPVIVFGLTAALLLLYRHSSTLASWVNALDLRALVLLHATRFVGFYFIQLEALGRLPAEFYQAGIGDIAVAILALIVAFLPLGGALRLRVFTIWNVVGLMDLLLVVLTAGRLAFSRPWEMTAFMQLPLSLLPTLLVPLLLASHVVIFIRLTRLRASR